MKTLLLGTLSAAAMTVAASGAFAAAHTGDMASVTCEDFLALDPVDQETHATALTMAMMDDGAMDTSTDASSDPAATASDDGSMTTDTDSAAMEGTATDTAATDTGAMDGTSTDSAESDTAELMDSEAPETTASDTDTAAMDSNSTETATSGTTPLATTGTDASDATGDTASADMDGDMQQSPTVIALVTICENSSNGM